MHPLINGNLIKNQRREEKTSLLSNFNHRLGIDGSEIIVLRTKAQVHGRWIFYAIVICINNREGGKERETRGENSKEYS